ncbi:MAG: hypothetical protein ACI9C4_001623 [Paraglaciecola sp.]|jgi:hypothetical protein
MLLFFINNIQCGISIFSDLLMGLQVTLHKYFHAFKVDIIHPLHGNKSRFLPLFTGYDNGFFTSSSSPSFTFVFPSHKGIVKLYRAFR